jgi:hypothetical protein
MIFERKICSIFPPVLHLVLVVVGQREMERFFREKWSTADAWQSLIANIGEDE